MQKLEIRYFGPVKECDIEISDFLVFTGTQASGKSTVAKSIFFFNHIKNILLQLVQRMNYESNDEIMNFTLRERLKREIRSNFLQIFGTTMAMDSRMRLKYTYENGYSITISLIDTPSQKNFADVKISDELWKKLCTFEQSIKKEESLDLLELSKAIYSDIFCDEYQTVYIPAGRSLMTLLSSQINYFYSTMDDIQKRSIDYCTQNYLERILRLKSFFTTSYSQIVDEVITTTNRKINKDVLGKAVRISHQILKGEYKNVSGEERLQISDDRYVKINYASSGQQESVWILNVLFYYLLNNIRAHFIIEEPESHLFPDAQKLIVEYIAMAKNQKNKVTLTTHSPYVLGSINNLLYAKKIADRNRKSEVEKIIPEQFWLDYNSIGAYFVKDGQVLNIRNDEYNDIDHDVIDGASRVINSDFEKMVDIDLEKGSNT